MGFVSRLLQHFTPSAVVKEHDVVVGGVVISQEGTNTALELDAQLVVMHPDDVYAFQKLQPISCWVMQILLERWLLDSLTWLVIKPWLLCGRRMTCIGLEPH